MRASKTGLLPSSRESAASEELKTTPGCSPTPSASDSYSRIMRSRANAVTISTPASRGAWRKYEMMVSSASNGTLFFSFHRNNGIASSEERGKSSKCCTKTRITGSGRIRATSSAFVRSRSQALATAFFAAPEFTRLVSTAEGITTPGGNNSTAKASGAPERLHLATATRSAAISIATGGCGIASSQRTTRRASPLL